MGYSTEWETSSDEEGERDEEEVPQQEKVCLLFVVAFRLSLFVCLFVACCCFYVCLFDIFVQNYYTHLQNGKII